MNQGTSSWNRGQSCGQNSWDAGVRVRLEGAGYLVSIEMLDVGAEGTAHKALRGIWVMQEADLQRNESVLQRQGLYELMALPVPYV